MRTRTHRIIRFYFWNDLSAANGDVRRIRCAIYAHPAHPSITIKYVNGGILVDHVALFQIFVLKIVAASGWWRT